MTARVYESVDDKSLPWDIFLKCTKTRVHATKGSKTLNIAVLIFLVSSC